MIGSADAKRYLFRTKQAFVRNDVSRIISEIEQTCRNIVDRTSLQPETLIVKTTFPVKDMLPAKELVLAEIQEVECKLKTAEAKEQLSELFRLSQTVFAPFGTSRFSTTFVRKSDRAEFMLWAVIQGSKASLTGLVSSRPFQSRLLKDPSAGRDYVQFFISAACLPLEIKSVPAGYVLGAASGASVKMDDCMSKDANPTGFDLSFERDSVRKVTAAFTAVFSHPELRLKEIGWLLDCPTPTPPEKQDVEGLLQAVNQARLPAQKIEVTAFWTVNGYRHFADMEKGATKQRREASLSLLEFEFERGRTAQLDAVVTAAGKYRLFFYFDDAADAPKVSRLLDVKLEEF